MKIKAKKNYISILVVDDDEYMLKSFSQLIALSGYTVHTALYEKKALDILSKKKVDVILTYIKMPGTDGIELIKTVKRQYPNIDVVIITGYGSIDVAAEATKQGASDYIFKPFTSNDIMSKIVDVCKKKEKRF